MKTTGLASRSLLLRPPCATQRSRRLSMRLDRGASFSCWGDARTWTSSKGSNTSYRFMSLGDHLGVTTFKRISLTLSGGVRDATYSRTVTRHLRRPGRRPSRPVSSTKEEHHAADLKPKDSLVTREHPVATHCPRCNWARPARTHGNGRLCYRGERGGCHGDRSVEWRSGAP